MKKLLLMLVTTPFVTTSCLLVEPEVKPEEPDNGTDGGTDGGADGGADDITPEPDPEETYRDIMTEIEIENYLKERSFAIIASDGLHSAGGMGSGWLFDESEDNWYIATNRHVTEALDNGDGTVMITNDWDRMWQEYDIRDYSFAVDGNGLFSGDSGSVENPMTTGEIWDLFIDLRLTADVAEIVYETIDPNEGNTSGVDALDYYDYAIVKVPKVTSMIDPLVEPIEIAPFEYVKDQYAYFYESKYFFKGYSFANGNYRFGSFFNNTYINAYNNTFSRAWSPSVYLDPPGTEAGLGNWGFDNGPGSSGSATVDERGYYIVNNTFGYSNIYPYRIGEAEGQGKFHHSGTSGQGVINTIIPAYQAVVGEKTLLNPNG